VPIASGSVHAIYEVSSVVMAESLSTLHCYYGEIAILIALRNVELILRDSTVTLSDSARNLGAIFDGHVSRKKHQRLDPLLLLLCTSISSQDSRPHSR